MTLHLIRRIRPATGAVFLFFLPLLILSALAGTARAQTPDPRTSGPQTARAKEAAEKPALWYGGVVTYRERMALPPDATLVIRLYHREGHGDRSLAAELRLPVAGRNVPLPFRIAVPETRADGAAGAPAKQTGQTADPIHELQAEIHGDDLLLFASEDIALPRKDGQNLKIMTHRVLPETAVLPETNETLAGARWRLSEVFGQPARAYDNQQEPHLVFMPEDANRGRIGGSDGCNRILGAYERKGDSVRFSGLGATMMLCPEGEEQANAYARALHEANAWRLTEDRLELRDGDRVLAVFTRVAL